MNTLTKEIKNKVWEILTTNIIITIGNAILPWLIVILFGIGILILIN